MLFYNLMAAGVLLLASTSLKKSRMSPKRKKFQILTAEKDNIRRFNNPIVSYQVSMLSVDTSIKTLTK